MPRIAEVLMKLKLSFERGDEEGEKTSFQKIYFEFFLQMSIGVGKHNIYIDGKLVSKLFYLLFRFVTLNSGDQ